MDKYKIVNKFFIYFTVMILDDENVEVDTTENLRMDRQNKSKIEISEFFSIKICEE